MQRSRIAAIAVLLLALVPVAGAQKNAKQGAMPLPAPVLTLSVDATDAPRKVFHAREEIPVAPGDIVLYYPKWIPGEHAPDGPMNEAVGMYFTANGKTLRWYRDKLDMWTFHVEVPAGVTKIEAALDFLSPANQASGFSSGSSATEKLAVLSWNWFVLYPKGSTSDQIQVTATLTRPRGWNFGTALPIMSDADAMVTKFAPASLTTLVDSPVIMGQYLKKVPLQQGKTPEHEMDIAADDAAALEMSDAQRANFDNLVAESGALFGARHYRDYHFLLTLSDNVAHFGLEHHESNDSRTDENYLTDPNTWALEASLLPHEFTHSWNGKYRRPADLATPEYETPMQDDLLWVYEGLTEYFGYVLTGRSGLWTPEQWRDQYATIAMTYTYRPGRDWRSLEDTATAAQLLYFAPHAFSNYRRSVDYYDEGALIWLEADTIIREKSNNTKSMDDFAHLFYGGQNTGPTLKTYTFDDVVSTLNQVVPYDWRGFFTERVINVAPKPPLNGILNGGWKVVYHDQPNAIMKATEDTEKSVDATASVGLLLREDGSVVDAIGNGVAAKAGIAPGMKLVAINGRKFTPAIFNAALVEARNTKQPLAFLIENTDYYRTVQISYFEGPRYPYLERDPSKPDLLSDIIRPRATAAK